MDINTNYGSEERNKEWKELWTNYSLILDTIINETNEVYQTAQHYINATDKVRYMWSNNFISIEQMNILEQRTINIFINKIARLLYL